MWSTWSIGGLLDGRKRAPEHELARLLGALASVLALGATDGHLRLSLVLGVLWSLSLAWLLSKLGALRGELERAVTRPTLPSG